MKLLLLILIFCFSSVFIDAQELNGVVKTADGKPIEKASVRPEYTETDKEGKFTVTVRRHKFIIVTKEKFRPLIRKLNGEPAIEILMDDETAADRLTIAECSVKRTGKNAGINFKLFIPKGFKSSKGQDVDYSNYFIYSAKDKNNYMRGWAGPNATSGYPDPDWIMSTDKINLRSVYNENRLIGLDYEGQTKDGKYWRYFRVMDESVYYFVNTIEQKTNFDKIIDGSCSTVERYYKK
jgi:hypothetical protein